MTADQALRGLGRVVRTTRCAAATSSPLDEVDLVRRDGSELRLLVKHLDGPHIGKPEFLRNPAREIDAYWLLAGENLGTPRCYASGRWWLALERLEGAPLWQQGDVGCWQGTARWAARLHDRFRGRQVAASLLRHDDCFYRRWFSRARTIVGIELETLRQPTETAISRLVRLPRTLIHGELYPSNVLIDGGRVAAVDWEMAASGPGVIDLAAVITGWDADRREAIIDAFGAVDRVDLAAAQLVLALQWLGWAADWEPPTAHRRDWLAEAHSAAGALT
jgi:hypothetical protein